jgi:hypothetical protein
VLVTLVVSAIVAAIAVYAGAKLHFPHDNSEGTATRQSPSSTPSPTITTDVTVTPVPEFTEPTATPVNLSTAQAALQSWLTAFNAKSVTSLAASTYADDEAGILKDEAKYRALASLGDNAPYVTSIKLGAITQAYGDTIISFTYKEQGYTEHSQARIRFNVGLQRWMVFEIGVASTPTRPTMTVNGKTYTGYIVVGKKYYKTDASMGLWPGDYKFVFYMNDVKNKKYIRYIDIRAQDILGY